MKTAYELDDADIRAIALDCGFKLKPQPDGLEDLNPYVYKFARELLSTIPRPEDVAAMLAAAPTPPAQDDEPVALIKVMNSFGLDVYEAELTDAGVNLPEGTKLYTRPDNGGLRKAAEELFIAKDLLSFNLAMDNLRAALEKS